MISLALDVLQHKLHHKASKAPPTTWPLECGPPVALLHKGWLQSYGPTGLWQQLAGTVTLHHLPIARQHQVK